MTKDVTAWEPLEGNLLSGDLAVDTQREWVAPNGIGGWASSTVAGINTRRYHGILVAALDPPAGRTLLLAHLEETAVVEKGREGSSGTKAYSGGKEYSLSSNIYPGVIHPDGYYRLASFELAPFPRYTYEFEGYAIVREVIPVHGRNAVVVAYRLSRLAADPNSGRVVVAIEPLVNCRDYHGITSRPGWHFEVRRTPPLADTSSRAPGTAGVWVWPSWAQSPSQGGPALYMEILAGKSSGIDIGPAGVWYRDMEYPRERERGLECREDHYSPCRFSAALEAGDACYLWVSAAGPPDRAAAREAGAAEAFVAGAYMREARAFRSRTVLPWLGIEAEGRLPHARGRDGGLGAGFGAALIRAADSFVVRCGSVTQWGGGGQAGGASHASIVAGYPWFEEWGRDAFISLPGLLLVTGRFEEARSVISHFAGYIDGGLVPNRIPSPGRPAEYGSVDASLWMVYAIWKYLQYTGDVDFARAIAGVVIEIMELYLAGTRHGIHATPNGMLWHREEGMQLTWMDARVDHRVITPRSGWAVEVNGLWFNALHAASAILKILGGDALCDATAGGVVKGPGPAEPGRLRLRAERYLSVAASMKKSFDWLMWDDQRGVAFDCRGPDGPDRRLRPNQLICMYLPFPLIAGQMAWPALELIMDELYTPLGIRTLGPREDEYVGRYRGGPAERDSAYHQGTAWPWLTGPLITAMRRADNYSDESRAAAGRLLEPFKDHLRQGGLGSISEVFDGDSPQEPGGCVSQAWSVAEVLRAYVEEYLDVRPAKPPFGGIQG